MTHKKNKADPNKVTNNKQAQNLPKWFWGTIIVLAIIAVLLAIWADYRTKTFYADVNNRSENPETSKTDFELTPEELRNAFDSIKNTAISETLQQLRPLVENAYAPTLKLIPDYTDWHYTVAASYIELSDKIKNNPTKELEKRLKLNELGEKLKGIANDLDKEFENNWNKNLNANFNTLELKSTNFGPLTSEILKSAKIQTGTTAATIISGAIFGPKLAATIGTKISAMMAAKIAAKTGAKFMMPLIGSSVGTVCGPLAPLCAVAGGILAWFGTDAVVGKLDSYFNQDEFNSSLEEILIQSQDEQIKLLSDQIKQKAIKQKQLIETNIKDFTIKQLTGSQKNKMCEQGKGIITEYEKFSSSLLGRKGDAEKELLAKSQTFFDSPLLFELAREIHTNLINADSTVLAQLNQISGNLPSGSRANRKISGFLIVNGDKFTIDKTNSTKETGFSIRHNQNSEPFEFKTNGNEILDFSIQIEQHHPLPLLKHKYFEGEMKRTMFDIAHQGKGLKHDGNIKIPVVEKDNAKNSESSEITLNFTISTDPLPVLIYQKVCSK